MSLEKQLQDGFSLLKKRGVDTFPAKVLEVDKAKGTCKVNDGEIDHADVRLASVINERGSFVYVFPKPGSSVLVSPIKEDIHNLYVEAYSEVEDFYLKVEGAEMRVDASGILLKKDDETARKLMLDLIAAIRALKFTTNQGPTITLINDAEFQALEPRVKALFKA